MSPRLNLGEDSLFLGTRSNKENDRPTSFFADRSNREAPIPCADFYTVASKCVIGREDALPVGFPASNGNLSSYHCYIFGGTGYYCNRRKPGRVKVGQRDGKVQNRKGHEMISVFARNVCTCVNDACSATSTRQRQRTSESEFESAPRCIIMILA